MPRRGWPTARPLRELSREGPKPARHRPHGSSRQRSRKRSMAVDHPAAATIRQLPRRSQTPHCCNRQRQPVRRCTRTRRMVPRRPGVLVQLRHRLGNHQGQLGPHGYRRRIRSIARDARHLRRSASGRRYRDLGKTRIAFDQQPNTPTHTHSRRRLSRHPVSFLRCSTSCR